MRFFSFNLMTAGWVQQVSSTALLMTLLIPSSFATSVATPKLSPKTAILKSTQQTVMIIQADTANPGKAVPTVTVITPTSKTTKPIDMKQLPPQPSPGLFTADEWAYVVTKEKLAAHNASSPANALLISLKEPDLAPPLPVKVIQGTMVTSHEGSVSSIMSQASHRLVWPMRRGIISSRFGPRWGRMHEGTDIAAPYGTPILASAKGKVIFTGWQGGYGQLIVISHSNGYITKYGHCANISVTTGQTVLQGQTIGHVGSTGNSTGPHLHYEVITSKNGKNNNPEYVTVKHP